jgi:exodeoxyribonuclease VII small subunit
VTGPEAKKAARAAPVKAVPATTAPATTAPATTAPARAGAGEAADGAMAVTPPLPYEQARDQLTELVKRLEAGGLTLEQSLELWERGERLADICAEWLEGARARLATATAARRDDSPADPAAPF